MKLLALARLLLTTSLLWMSLSAHAETFTSNQQQHIQKIVHDYLLQNPQVLIEAGQALEQQQMNKMQQQAAQGIQSNADQLFYAPATPSIGSAQSDINLVEFFDYQCGHCRKMAPVIAKLLQEDNKLRVVFKQLPVFGEQAEYTAKLALAAQKQGKFFAFHQALMQADSQLTAGKILQIAKTIGLNTQQLLADSQSAAILQELQANQKLANSLGIMGTPAIIVAKAKANKAAFYYLPGAVKPATLAKIILQIRQTK